MTYSDSNINTAVFVHLEKIENKEMIKDFVLSIQNQMLLAMESNEESSNITSDLNNENIEIKVNYAENNNFLMLYWLKNEKLINSFKSY